MNLTELVLDAVDRTFSAETRRKFMDRFTATGFGSELEKPLLSGSGKTEKTFISLSDVPLNAISAIRIDNPSAESIHINIAVDLKGDSKTVAELFNRFVQCTAHTNHLGDFRKVPEYYALIYAGQRYMVGHGDGHCVALGLLFQGACRSLLGEDVTLNYCRTDNWNFTHVFATHQASDGSVTYIDPDQKTLCNVDKMDCALPDGFLFQLISQAGMKVYDKAREKGRGWLFPSMCDDNFARYGKAEMAVFEKMPDLEKITRLYNDARNTNSEVIEIQSDDYPWKTAYRKEAAPLAQVGSYFLTDLDCPMPFTLPAGARFEIGFGFGSLPEEVAELCAIFFGRVPGVIRANLSAGHKANFFVVQLPWLIMFSPEVNHIIINDNCVKTRASACGQFTVLGMADLELIFDINASSFEFDVKVNQDAELGVVLPLNAFALNSGFSVFSGGNKQTSITAHI